MNVNDLRTRTKVLIVSAGVLGLAGLGIGAANAAAPGLATTQSVTATQSGTADNATQSGTADNATQSGTADTPTPGDVADAPGAVESNEAADSPEAPGDTGPNVEQTGDHTDPGDAPGSP